MAAMLPATNDLVMNRGASLEARAYVSTDLPVTAACLIFLAADGTTVVGTFNASPAVLVDTFDNAVDIRLTGEQTAEALDGGATSFQLDVKSADGNTFRILKGRVVKATGVVPVFPA